MKKRKIILLLVILTLLFVSFVLAEEIQMSDGVKIITSNVDYSSSDKNMDADSVLTFTFKEDGALRIGSEDYWNIEKDGTIVTDTNGKITSAKFTVNEDGGTYVFGNDKIYAPPKSVVSFKDNKIEILVSTGGELKSLPESNSPSIENTPLNTVVYNVMEENFILPGGNSISGGKLIFNRNGVYLQQLNEVRDVMLSGISLQGNALSKPLRLFFNGEEQIEIKENYLSLNPSEKKVFFHFNVENNMRLDFRDNNPFINIEFPGRGFTLTPGEAGFDLSINNAGAVPNLNFKNIQSIGKKANLFENGVLNFQYKEGMFGKDLEVTRNGQILQDNGVPMVVSFDGEKILGPNEVLFIQKDSSEYTLTKNSPELLEKIKTSMQKDPIRDKAIEDLKYSFPGISFKNLDKLSLSEIQSFKNDLNGVPEQLISKTHSINFYDTGFANPLANAAAYGGSMSIVIKPQYIDTATLIHESTHNFHTDNPSFYSGLTMVEKEKILQEFNDEADKFFIENNIRDSTGIIKLNSEFYPERSELNYGSKLTTVPVQETLKKYLPEISQEFFKIENKYYGRLSKMNNNNFDTKWFVVQKPSSYLRPGEFIYREESIIPLSLGQAEANLGFISAYGSTKQKEDVAEFVTYIYTDPERFKNLLNFKKNSYAFIYRTKLDLLLEYGFIPLEKYEEILKIGGAQ